MTKQCASNGTNYSTILSRIKSLDPYNKAQYKDRDDLTISRLFSDIYKNVLRYNATAKEWYNYDGCIWGKDTGSMKTESYAKTFVRAMMVYSLMDVNDPAFTRFLSKYGDRNARKRMIEDARDYNHIEQSDFDTDGNLLNCLNCVIDLNTFKTIDHDPSLLLSKVANVTYNPDIRSDDFTRFIHQIMQDDEDKINYLQRLLGYSLTGENTQEQCYICYGASTRNGKSTLLDTIGNMLGDYAMNIEPESLALKDRNTKNASGDVARLDGCRFLHMGEPPKRMMFNTALLKHLTGRDPVTARNLYEREFQFKPVFKLILNTNYLPVITDDSVFSSDRIQVIEFNRHFSPEEQDRTLKRRLLSDDNLTGILNWCLDGLRAFKADGEILIPPESVVNATKMYRDKSDKTGNFINDCLVHITGENTPVSEVYSIYSTWCRSNGYNLENRHNFIDELRTKDIYIPSATIYGKTVRNIVKDYAIDESYRGNCPAFDD